MLIRYFTGNKKDDKGNKGFKGINTKFDYVMNLVLNIVSAIAIIQVSLLLAVTLTLAY